MMTYDFNFDVHGTLQFNGIKAYSMEEAQQKAEHLMLQWLRDNCNFQDPDWELTEVYWDGE